MRRQEDWLRQADRDLAHARRALEAGDRRAIGHAERIMAHVRSHLPAP